MQRRKDTAWKKSRTFGDVHGGRSAPKLTDGIFARAHSLERPSPGQALPITRTDNPSRDFYFPLSTAECLETLSALPQRHVAGVTHLWLRRPRASERRRATPFAEYVCGSGVRAIIIYPWPNDRRVCLGRTKPTQRLSREYQRFGAEVSRKHGWWYVTFDPDSVRRYCVHVLLHEVGHHIDLVQFRLSAANRRRREEAAEQYAVRFAKTGAHEVAGLERRAAADASS